MDNTKSDYLLNLWYTNPAYHQKCKTYISEYKKSLKAAQSKNLQSLNFKKLARASIFKCMKMSKMAFKSKAFLLALFFVSIMLRLLCMLIIFYVVLIMVHETDSWIPCVILFFCLGIFCDLIYFIRRAKEHTG
jgi:hypothetical protein